MECPKCKFQFEPDAKSNKQCAYLHILFKALADYSGETPQYTKLAMKEMFGYYDYYDSKEEKHRFKVYRTISTMNKRELSKFIDEVYLFCNSEGLQVLSPEEYCNSAETKQK